MTVNPGWGGQAFLPELAGQARRLRALLGRRPALEVDGGIDAETAGACAGRARPCSSPGSAVFGAADPAAAVRPMAEATTPLGTASRMGG